MRPSEVLQAVLVAEIMGRAKDQLRAIGLERSAIVDTLAMDCAAGAAAGDMTRDDLVKLVTDYYDKCRATLEDLHRRAGVSG